MAPDPSEDRNALPFAALVAWARRETPPVHAHAANLLIHLFAVPLFVVGNGLVVAGFVFGRRLAAGGLLAIVVSLALQKFGHSLEQSQAPAFAGARDFLRRIHAEQFCNFRRFLFSGRWYAQFRARRENA